MIEKTKLSKERLGMLQLFATRALRSAERGDYYERPWKQLKFLIELTEYEDVRRRHQ